MKNEHITHLLSDFLDKRLNAEEHKQVAHHLEQCTACSDYMEELKLLFTAFREEETPVPSARLQMRFNEMLESEIHKNNKPPFLLKQWLAPTLKIAASVLLLIGAFSLGAHHQKIETISPIVNVKKQHNPYKEIAALSLMESESASKRIQAINNIEKIANLDPKITNALIARMHKDPNTNVRLTAVQALERLSSSEIVKNAYLVALENEKNPGIQITIINILVQIQEKKAVKLMRRMLQQQEIEPYVKEQIKTLMPTLI